jgi:hypothetical protein
MKTYIFLVLAVFTFILNSCQKDTLDDKALGTLQIDDVTHTYLSKDGKRYLENTLNSQEASHIYKVNLVKGVPYRISVSQPGALMNQTTLKLVNKEGELLAESNYEGPYKSLIVIYPPRTDSYYVTVKLDKRTNPRFNYRLFFEEIREDDAILSGLNWKVIGDWTVINPNTIELKNHDSHIYRHIRISDPLSDIFNVSFVLKSSSSIAPNFGLLLSASDEYMQFGEYSYEFTNLGHVFLAMKQDDSYSFITLGNGFMSSDWGSLSTLSMNFASGVKVDLKYDLGGFTVYINDSPVRSFNALFSNIYIVLYDQGDGVTTIQDLQLGS